MDSAAVLQFAAALSPASQGLATALVFVSTLCYLIRRQEFAAQLGTVAFSSIHVPMLQLLPLHTLSHPWVLVTAVFCETSVVGLVVAAAVLVAGSHYAYRVWGSQAAVLKFVLVVGVATNLATVLTVILLALVTGNTGELEQPTGGCVLYVVGFLVVLKQAVPEHAVSVLLRYRVRVKQLPLGLVGVAVVVLVLRQHVYPAVPAFYALVLAWGYLRFVQSSLLDPTLPLPGGAVGTRRVYGDASDAFAFAEFFPASVRDTVAPALDKVYELAVLLSIVPSFDEEAREVSNARVRERAGDTAERRRAVALRVIEERMGN